MKITQNKLNEALIYAHKAARSGIALSFAPGHGPRQGAFRVHRQGTDLVWETDLEKVKTFIDGYVACWMKI